MCKFIFTIHRHADISSQSNSEPIIAPLKAENLATKFKSSVDTIKPRSRENSRATSPFKSHDRYLLTVLYFLYGSLYLFRFSWSSVV